MKFTFENLGPLSMGELDIADLTILCGANNTGKTYLTYALYGLLKTCDRYIKLPDYSSRLFINKGEMKINLETQVIAHAPRIIAQAVNLYCENLYRVLASQPTRFSDTKLELSLNFENVLEPSYEGQINVGSHRTISFVKDRNDPVLNISATVEGGYESRSPFSYRPIIQNIIKQICFAPVLPPPFIVSTERTGAVTFQSELNLAKNRLLDFAGEMNNASDLNPALLLERVANGGYPMPVMDNVDFINTLPLIQNQESELLKKHPAFLDEFEALIGGSYKLQSQGNVLNFVPKGTRGVRLRMGESSSAVRSLVLLGYYLKHRARPGDLLMIDEPELNLHPANQRRLARLLARLVNAGIKVFVTTHSDYIIKEFNTLIMLNHASPYLDPIRQKWGYTLEDCLAPGAVRVYMLRDDMILKPGKSRRSMAPTLCPAPISPTLGIEVASFDDTINEMNAIQEAIYYGND